MNLLDAFEVSLPREEASAVSLFVLKLHDEICTALDVDYVDFSTDFEWLKAIQQANAAPENGDWPGLNPAFDFSFQSRSLSATSFFLSIEIAGKVMATKAIKLKRLMPGQTLHSSLEDLSFIYDDPSRFSDDRVICGCDTAFQIRGCYIADSGALWVHPDLRGKGLNIGGKITLLSHAVAFGIYPVDWFVAMINPETTIRILHRDQGFTRVEFPFYWRCAAHPMVEKSVKALEFKARHELRNHMFTYAEGPSTADAGTADAGTGDASAGSVSLEFN